MSESTQKMISSGVRVEVLSSVLTAVRPKSCWIEVYRLLTSRVTSRLLEGMLGWLRMISRKWPVSCRYEGVAFISGVSIFSRCWASGEKIESVDATIGCPRGF